MIIIINHVIDYDYYNYSLKLPIMAYAFGIIFVYRYHKYLSQQPFFLEIYMPIPKFDKKKTMNSMDSLVRYGLLDQIY